MRVDAVCDFFFVFGVFWFHENKDENECKVTKTKAMLCNKRMQNVHARYVKERKDFCLGTNKCFG